MITVIKYLCLIMGIVYGFSNVGKILLTIKGDLQDITDFQIWAMAIGIVGYIALECIF